MVEWSQQPELLQQGLEALGLLALGMAFRRSIRREVYDSQGGRCAECGEEFCKLETHHRLPRALGGPDTIDNAVGLCGPPPEGNGCHQEADRLAFQGIIYPQVHGK